MKENLAAYLEALIFTSTQSVGLEEMMDTLQNYFQRNIQAEEIHRAIEEITEKFSKQNSALQLVQINSGYQFLTKEKFHPIVQMLQSHRAQKKLSQSALETLAIIAYRQPVTKLEIEQIRRVNCDYSIQKLLDKNLIRIAGKAETVGRPILYQTSEFFGDYFGINHISDLPQLKEMFKDENKIGDVNE